MNRSERRSVLHAAQRVIGVASITSLRRSGRQILRRSQNIAVGADASFSRPGNGGVIVRLHLCLRLRTAFTRECFACKTIVRIEKIQNQPSCFHFSPPSYYILFLFWIFFLLHHHELHLCVVSACARASAFITIVLCGCAMLRGAYTPKRYFISAPTRLAGV